MNLLHNTIYDKKPLQESLRKQYGKTLLKMGHDYNDIMVVAADLAGSVQVQTFGDAFPERFINMGLSEQDMIGMATGLALSGKKVFVSTFAVFETGRCWEQIRQLLGHQNLPVKLVSTHGGLTVGPDGATHQTCEDIAIMRAIPNMKVIVPADANETDLVIKAIYDLDSPVYVRTSRLEFPNVFNENYKFEIGKAVEVVSSSDDKLTFVAAGLMLYESIIAAKILKDKHNISARVINCSTLKPLDVNTIVKASEETRRIITVEEHNIIGGLGSAVCDAVCEHAPCRVKRIGVPDVYGTSGDADEVLKHYGLHHQDIVKQALEMME